MATTREMEGTVRLRLAVRAAAGKSAFANAFRSRAPLGYRIAA